MRWASDCTMGRDSVPRGFDWISAESCSSLTFLLPSKAMRPITGFSTTVTTSRPPALLILHVLEQAGLDQRLEAVVDCGLVQAAIGAGLEIGADGLDLDTPVALDGDRSQGLSGCRRRHKHGRQRGGHRHGKHDQGGE